jgi:hypothetical protein
MHKYTNIPEKILVHSFIKRWDIYCLGNGLKKKEKNLYGLKKSFLKKKKK